MSKNIIDKSPNIYPAIKTTTKVFVIIAGLLSLIIFFIYTLIDSHQPLGHTLQMKQSFELMSKAISEISEYTINRNIILEESIDPNRTGLIGPEYTELTTTIGHLEAKRTSTNPEMASLILQQLAEAGVSKNDTIAIGASSSFPALLIATLAAAKVLGVYPIIIVSLGSSSYGATNIDFNILHIISLLNERNIFKIKMNAVSIGGEYDVGINLEQEIIEQLKKQIVDSKFEFIYEADLQKNVSKRMNKYYNKSKKIKAFINIGGNYANLGSSEMILNLNSGLNTSMSLPSNEKMGVIFKMWAAGVPVIHLLNLKSFAINNNILWDPVPFPKFENSKLSYTSEKNSFNLYIISIIYFSLLILLFYLVIIKKYFLSDKGR